MIRAGDVLTYQPQEPWLTLRRGAECTVLYTNKSSVLVEFADTTKWMVRATDLQDERTTMNGAA